MKHLLTLILPALVMGGAARADGPMPSWPANLGGYFEVQAGKLHGNFLECSFGSRSEVAEQRIVSKSGQDTVMKVPGRQRTDDLVCLRAVAAEDGFRAWRQLVAEGEESGRPARKSRSPPTTSAVSRSAAGRC
jgi:hypothetical protein